MRYLRITSIYLLLVMGFAACVPAAPTSRPIPDNHQTVTPEATDMPSTPPLVEKFVSLSKRDLANRLQIDASQISLVRTEHIVWLNAALGCPRPGKMYPQGRVPGYRIWLNTQGKEYLYHTDYHGRLILCPELNPDVPGPVTPTPKIGVPRD